MIFVNVRGVGDLVSHSNFFHLSWGVLEFADVEDVGLSTKLLGRWLEEGAIEVPWKSKKKGCRLNFDYLLFT